MSLSASKHNPSTAQPLHGAVRQGLAAVKQTPVAPLLLALWVTFAVFTPNFATAMNMQTLLAGTAVVAIAAAGETLVLLTGGIDLSVTTVISCSSVLGATAMAHTGSPLVGVLVALLVGLLFGLVNGLAVGIFGVTPFVFTLGTYLIARGIAFTVSGGIAVRGTPPALMEFGYATLLGIPAVAVVAILVMLAVGWLLTNTDWGRQVYLVGANEKAARYVGIRSPWIIGSVYIMAGLLGGLAGYISIASLGVALPGTGDTIMMTIIGGVILGGTSMFGGEGSMWRTALGVLLLASLTNGLNILGFAFYDQLIAQGLVILIGTGLGVRLNQAAQRD